MDGMSRQLSIYTFSSSVCEVDPWCGGSPSPIDLSTLATLYSLFKCTGSLQYCESGVPTTFQSIDTMCIRLVGRECSQLGGNGTPLARDRCRFE